MCGLLPSQPQGLLATGAPGTVPLSAPQGTGSSSSNPRVAEICPQCLVSDICLRMPQTILLWGDYMAPQGAGGQKKKKKKIIIDGLPFWMVGDRLLLSGSILTAQPFDPVAALWVPDTSETALYRQTSL